MAYRINEPYNGLPHLPPVHEIETQPVLHRCISASRALAELKGAGNLIPNQDPDQFDHLARSPAEFRDRKYRHHPGCPLPCRRRRTGPRRFSHA